MIMKLLIIACLAVAVFGHTFDKEDTKVFKSAFRRTCINNGVEDKAPQAEAALDAVIECFKAQIDPDIIRNEIEAARPKGTVDEVFKKYCDKKPAFKACIKTLYDGIYPCLHPNIRGHLNLDKNATDSFLNFICHNDGERIALFIAEGGSECFDANEAQMRQCVSNMGKDIDATDEVKNMSIDTFCKRITAVTSCTVTALEGCTSPTPSNMAEALFNYVKNSTPCKDHGN